MCFILNSPYKKGMCEGVSKQSPGPLNSTLPLGSEIPASATASVSTHLYMGLQVESMFVSRSPEKESKASE